MKRTYPFFIILLILITSSCNTFNSGNLFSSRQGKNKVIDRDFEQQVEHEEENQIVETESYQEPVHTNEVPYESVESEPNSEPIAEPSQGSISFEENLAETEAPFGDSETPNVENNENQKIDSEKVVQANDDNSDPDKTAKVALIIILVIVGIVLLLFLLLLLFILSLF